MFNLQLRSITNLAIYEFFCRVEFHRHTEGMVMVSRRFDFPHLTKHSCVKCSLHTKLFSLISCLFRGLCFANASIQFFLTIELAGKL